MPVDRQAAAARNADRNKFKLRCLDGIKGFNLLREAQGEDPARVTNLHRSYTSTLRYFDQMEEAHIAYMLASGFTPGEAGVEDNFLENVRKEVLKMEMPADPAAAEASRRTRCRLKLATKQLAQELEPRVAALTAAAGNLEGIQQVAVVRYLAEIADLRAAIPRDYLPAVNLHLDSVELEQLETASGQYHAQTLAWRTALAASHAVFMGVLTEPVHAAQVPDPLPGVAVPGAAQQAPPQPVRRVTAKLAPATLSFSGRPRDYLTFKSTAKEMLGTDLGPFVQHQYLWAALPEEVKDNCSSYTQDPAELWKQLDKLFEHPTVQVEAAVGDISQVMNDPRLDDETRIKRLAIVYDGVVTSLQQAGMEAELKADLFIQRLVALLPTHEVKQFTQRVQQGTITGFSEYEKLSRFLNARAEEIMMSERLLGTSQQSRSTAALRNFGLVVDTNRTESCNTGSAAPSESGRYFPAKRRAMKCKNCGGTDHDMDMIGCKVPVIQCEKCRGFGHEERDCTQRSRRDARKIHATKRDRDRSRSRSRSRSLSAPPSRQANHAGSAGRCRRCAGNRSGLECPACKKMGAPHCLQHCEKYVMSDVTGRAAIAKAAQACPFCLGVGHDYADCKSKGRGETKDRECGINGCKKMHHRSLHGTQDPYVTRHCGHTSTLPPPDTDSEPGAFRRIGTAPHAPIIFANFSTDLAVSESRERELEEMRQFALSPEEPPPTVLMVIMEVAVQYGPQAERSTVTLFADSGSTCTIVKNSCARRLGLHGRAVIVYMRTVNGERKLETHLFWLELIDAKGNKCVVYALGMDEITSEVLEVDLEGVKHQFTGEARRRWRELAARPRGEVDVLLGSDYAGYHATRVIQVSEHLIMAESPLSSKMVAQGTHPSLSVPHCKWNPDVLALRTARMTHHIAHGAAPQCAALRVTCDYKVMDAEILDDLSDVLPPCPRQQREDETASSTLHQQVRPSELTGAQVSHIFHQLCQSQSHLQSFITEAEFLAGEQLGVEAPRRCPRCRGCRECSEHGQRVTEREQAELDLIRQGVSFDADRREFNVTFPWIRDPAELDNNYGQARKIAQNWEQKYAERGLTDKANEVFSGMIANGMLRPITKEECSRWSGPLHYVAIQGVESLSPSTPLRLVTNTSLRGRNGISPNDCLAKGPDLLQDPFDIWSRFRTYEEVLMSDVSKAYHRLRTGEVEMHTRRVLWRFSPDEDWQVFGLLCVSFGDRPAAAVLEVVLQLCAELFGHIDPEAALRVVKDRFVDDLHSGGTAEQVARFVGEEKEDGSFSGTIPQIFEAGGLRLKAVVRSGEPDGERLAKLGNSLMGHGVSTEQDTIWVNVEFNFHKKKGRAASGPNISRQNAVAELSQIEFTRRLALSAVSGIYDPYGYLAPVTVVLRAAVRQLFEPDLALGWDDPLPQRLQTWWREKLAMMLSVERVVLPRSARRAGLSELILVVFWDASKEAVAAVVYCVWLDGNGNHVALFCAKTKLAPSGMLSVPRLELLAALLASRLGRRVVFALSSAEFRVKACLWVGDSETILAALTKSRTQFSDFFSNRVLEIKENVAEVAKLTHTEDWLHVPGELNPADRPSRLDSTMQDISPDSDWMVGPAYLKLPRDQWPFNRNYQDRRSEPEFPKEELNKRGIRQLVDSNTVLLSDLPGLIHDRAQGLLETALPQPEDRTTASHLTPSQEIMVVQAHCLDSSPRCDATHLSCNQLSHYAADGSEDRVQGWLHQGQDTNCWEKVLRRTALLYNWITKFRGKTGQPDGLTGQVGGDGPPTPHLASGQQPRTARDRALHYWLSIAMPATRTAHAAGRLSALTLFEQDGLLRVRGRAGAGLEAAFQQNSLPVIMSETRLAFLLVLHAHEMDHAGRDITVHLTRNTAWIVGGRVLAGRITASCVRCMFLQCRLEGQRMAPLPAAIQCPAPPWTYIGLDYAGPFTCKKGRTTRANAGTIKVWALVIACLGTKAVSVRLVPGYGTEDLLIAMQIHVADCGLPLWVHTDRGSQLVKAGKAVNQDLPDWDWAEMAKLGAGAMRWSSCPSGAQFRNGALESVVKKLKKTLKHTFGKQVLTTFELELAFRKASSLANSRPVYAHSKPGASESSEYLQQITPNHLLLGRASPETHHPEWDLLAGPHARLSYVSDLTESWWRQWTVTNLPDMVPTRNWRVEHRAVQPGDIVLVLYDGKIKSNYRLARVMLQEPSESDNLTRTVVVRYSLPLPAASENSKRANPAQLPKPKYLRLAVQRLAVILPSEDQSPTPVISQEEADQALKAVGPKQPAPPPPLPYLPVTDLPAPPPCLLDLFRLPDPSAQQPAQPSAPSPRQPRSARRNPRLPDPASSPPRTRAAARLAHHQISLCSRVWNARFSDCRALSARISHLYLVEESDHGGEMRAWSKAREPACTLEKYHGTGLGGT